MERKLKKKRKGALTRESDPIHSGSRALLLVLTQNTRSDNIHAVVDVERVTEEKRKRRIEKIAAKDHLMRTERLSNLEMQIFKVMKVSMPLSSKDQMSHLPRLLFARRAVSISAIHDHKTACTIAEASGLGGRELKACVDTLSGRRNAARKSRHTATGIKLATAEQGDTEELKTGGKEVDSAARAPGVDEEMVVQAVSFHEQAREEISWEVPQIQVCRVEMRKWKLSYKYIPVYQSLF